MLNEDRVKLMTRMASFEAEEGRKDVPIARHFRSDYVGLQVIKAVICATIAYMIVFGVYIFANFENLMVDIYKINLMDLGKTVLKYYVEFIVVYAVLVYVAFVIKFNQAKKHLRRYFNNLKLLNSMYAREEATRQRTEGTEGQV